MSLDIEASRAAAGSPATTLQDIEKKAAANGDRHSDSDTATIEGIDGGVDGADLAAEKSRNDVTATVSRPLPLTVDEEGNPVPWDWETDKANPYNWSKGRKWSIVGFIASIGFLTSVGTSIMSPAHGALMEEFGVSSTVAMLPLTFYVVALGIGPIIIGGPLSESIGRLPILALGTPVGMLFLIGAALTKTFAGLVVLRFLAGFVLAPSLAIASGVLTETFRPVERGLPSAIFIMTPFLGPGMGPVLGSFAMRKGWRWTQWTLVFFAAFSILISLLAGRETYHAVLKRRRAKQLGITLPAEDLRPDIPWSHRIHAFLTVGLIRPLHMMAVDAIVGLSCLYIACEFATLFSFFAAVPFVFELVYGFTLEQSGLVFLSIVVGVFLGVLTILLCDIFIYKKRLVPAHRAAHGGHPPPEHRLYAAMIGSVGLPIGLFWFGWTGYHHVHWASPAVAIVPFAWGNICIFINLMQYMSDAYTGSVVASAASANSLARYVLAGVFPLFTLQMYENLGIGWASSLLGFIAAALLPVPWLFFKFGEQIRNRSRYTKMR